MCILASNNFVDDTKYISSPYSSTSALCGEDVTILICRLSHILVQFFDNGDVFFRSFQWCWINSTVADQI